MPISYPDMITAQRESPNAIRHHWLSDHEVIAYFEGDEIPLPPIDSDPPPIKVTATQFIKALFSFDLYDAVVAAVEASPNAQLKALFYRAPFFSSDDPDVQAMAQAIGLTTEQTRAVFVHAETL